MKLIVGLGNPGSQYAANRHNIGFILLDAIAGNATWREKFNGFETRVRLGGDDVVLLKPMTFMNLSGQSVSACSKFYKIDVRDILVIHDELDLPPSKIKMKVGGGHAGHNGLRSIIAHMGAEFERMRVGIGHPGDKSRVADYVLHDFARADDVWIGQLQDRLPMQIVHWVEGNNSKLIQGLGKDEVKPEPKPKAQSRPAPKAETPAAKSPFDGLRGLFKS